MYSVPHPVSAIRTRMRQEFERNRFVNKLPVIDVLLMKSNADYQVRLNLYRTFWEGRGKGGCKGWRTIGSWLWWFLRNDKSCLKLC